LKIGQRIKICFSFINKGKTPANKIKADIVLDIFDESSNFGGIYGLGSTMPNQNYGTIGPELTKSLSYISYRVWNKKDSIDFINHRTSILFFGCVTYEDTFRDIDTTRFCLKITTPISYAEMPDYNEVK
ncbi:MAG TPA: hypothetical protein VGB37_03405, partial [Candidatus Lokiarchaeia archaeon]